MAQGNYSEAVQYEQNMTQDILNHPEHLKMFQTISNIPLQIFMK